MILLTGATGQAGSNVANELSKTGTRFRVMVRDPAKAQALRQSNIEIVQGDFTNPKSMKAALKGIERLMLIAPPSPDIPHIEAQATAAAKRAGVRHVVQLSSAGADLKSPMRFGSLHGQAEKNLEASGLAWTHLRPTFFMHNLLGLAGMVKSGTIYFDAGDGKAPFVDLADVGAVAAKVLTGSGHESKIYEITGPAALGYADIAAIFSRLLGKKVTYVNIPHEAMKQNLLKAGLDEWRAGGIVQLSQAMSTGAMARVTDTVQKIAGRSPNSVEQFLRANLATFGG
jgi:uncharacterized protein YbjT (DUF2867 family)